MSEFGQDLFFERAGIDADPDRDQMALTHLDDRFDLRFIADVSGVDPNLVNAAIYRFEREPMIEMDVRHQGQIGRFFDFFDRSSVLKIQNGEAHKLRARFFKGVDLLEGCLYILGFGIGHALDQDSVIAAKSELADLDLPGFVSFIQFMITCFDYTLFCKKLCRFIGLSDRF